MHPRVLRELADVIARPLLIIIERLLQVGAVLEDWRKAEVTLIFKDQPLCPDWLKIFIKDLDEVCQRVMWPSGETSSNWRNRLTETSCNSTRKSVESYKWVGITPITSTCWEPHSCKAVCQKRTWKSW